MRQKAMTEHKVIIQQAFREFINKQILSRLDIPDEAKAKTDTTSMPSQPIVSVATAIENGIITTERELEVFRWVQQRLAFLVRDEDLFSEIRHVNFRDFQGKFAVYYKWERKGRLFDFIENKADAAASRYRFRFPEDLPGMPKELVADQLLELDPPLLAAFKARIGS